MYDTSSPRKLKGTINNIYYVNDSTDKAWLKSKCGNTFDTPSAGTTYLDWGKITNTTVSDVVYQ